jgi:hypothetical protein
VTPEQVREVMDQPPYWLAGSYLPGYKSGRISTTVLAGAVVAACGGSAYDDESVRVAEGALERLGYGDGVVAAWV